MARRTCLGIGALLSALDATGGISAPTATGSLKSPFNIGLSVDKIALGRKITRMSATLEKAPAKPATARSTFILRFVSTIALWSIALAIMFSGYEILYVILISVFGLLALWEFYRMLDQRALPNFKVTGLICAAVMLW